MYGELADWFHLLTAPSEYAEEADEVLALLAANVEGPLLTALELGSGGGNLASHLARRLRPTLTDLEPAMLEVSRSINPGLDHVQGDMRTLRLGRTFDAVVAHDAITYMRTRPDLRAALETAFVHLRPGGAAVFLPDWTRETYEPRTEHGGHDGEGRALRYLEWDQPLDPADPTRVVTEYAVLTRDEAGRVHLTRDRHVLGIFGRASWLELLAEVGFQASLVTRNEGYDGFVGRRPGV
jgi:SAM-dependent methyltransferase